MKPEQNTNEPVIEQKVPRVLLEILCYNVEENKDEFKKHLDEIQTQISKIKKPIRILWYLDKGEKTEEEKIQWLIENAKAKYTVLYNNNQTTENFVKNCIEAIKNFEKSYDNLKKLGVKIAKR